MGRRKKKKRTTPRPGEGEDAPRPRSNSDPTWQSRIPGGGKKTLFLSFAEDFMNDKDTSSSSEGSGDEKNLNKIVRVRSMDRAQMMKNLRRMPHLSPETKGGKT